MPAVTRLGDKCSGHGCWPPRGNDQASPDVAANNIGIHRTGDHWPVHCCGTNCHDGNLAKGSSTVFVNNKAMSRTGDPVSCGSSAHQGSPNVYCGG